MSDSHSGTSGLSTLYRIEQLKENNWWSWKFKIETILDDKRLRGYIDGKKKRPAENSPLKDEIEKWDDEDQMARTVIKLLVHDSQTIHCAGAKTAYELWQQLKAVKEPRGQTGIITWRKKLYATRAKWDTDIPTHLKHLREIYETLHTMGDNGISDSEFKTTIMTSLPESWDQFLTIYTQPGSTANDINSHELYAILMEEDRKRKASKRGQYDESKKRRRRDDAQSQDKIDNAALITCFTKCKLGDRISGPKRCTICKKNGHIADQCWHKGNNTCLNCKRPGHSKNDCWRPGGGKEGQGPTRQWQGPQKDSANVATSSSITEIDDLMDEIAFMAQDESLEFVDSEQSEEHLIWYDWLVDSGTTTHITNSCATMNDYIPLDKYVSGIGNNSLNAIGKGTVELTSFIGKTQINFKLTDVLYVPKATHNLVSMSRLDRDGGHAEVKNGLMNLFSKAGTQFAQAQLQRGLYILNARAKLHLLSNACITHHSGSVRTTWADWHKRYGHIGYSGLQRLQREKLVDGMDVIDEHAPILDCEACIQAKQTRAPFQQKTGEDKQTIPGTLTHSDVWGPIDVESIGGSKYFITFIDDCTRRCTVEFMKHKSEAPEKLKQYVSKLRNQYDKKPTAIRIDNGREYINDNLVSWCRNEGIEMQRTAPYSPQQNGTAERFNRTLMELARAMLIARKLPEHLWAEAVSHAAYLRN